MAFASVERCYDQTIRVYPRMHKVRGISSLSQCDLPFLSAILPIRVIAVVRSRDRDQHPESHYSLFQYNRVEQNSPTVSGLVRNYLSQSSKTSPAPATHNAAG